MVEQEIFRSLADFIFFPTDELGLECLQNGRSGSGAVDENQSEASWRMLQSKTGQNVGSEKGKYLSVRKIKINARKIR